MSAIHDDIALAEAAVAVAVAVSSSASQSKESEAASPAMVVSLWQRGMHWRWWCHCLVTPRAPLQGNMHSTYFLIYACLQIKEM